MKSNSQTRGFSYNYLNYPYVKKEWLAGFEATEFIQGCRIGNITQESMHAFIQQHFYYSGHFTRALATLLAHLQTKNYRPVLARNLFAELGVLNDGMVISHATLYRTMMRLMGVKEASGPYPATQELITVLFDCCRSPNYMVGLGAVCLGVEAIVPYLYSAIMSGFLALGVPEDHLLFFKLHVERDYTQYSAMYRILDDELSANPGSRFSLNYGAEKVIRARIAFFKSLIPEHEGDALRAL